MDTLEDRIRKRAYQLWLDEGQPHGRADIHWDMACELVAIEDGQMATLKPAQDTQAPAEPSEAAENVGEAPTLTDQSEQVYPPRRVQERKAV